MQLLIRPNERIDKIKWNLHFFPDVQHALQKNIPQNCLHSGDVMLNSNSSNNNTNGHFVHPLLPTFASTNRTVLQNYIANILIAIKECSSLQLENAIPCIEFECILFATALRFIGLPGKLCPKPCSVHTDTLMDCARTGVISTKQCLPSEDKHP